MDLNAPNVVPPGHSHAHPSDRTYIEIAIILTIITVVEVAIWYIDWMHDVGALVPALIILSLAKFLTVIGFYMHLKFDDPFFRHIFLAGLVIAIMVVSALIVLLVTHEIQVATTFLD